METDKIRDAILEKAKGEAATIVVEAETRAAEMLQKAQNQKNEQFEDEKKRIISEARREASKLAAQASLKARQDILRQKDAILNRIRDKVKTELAETVMDKTLFLSLVKETIDALETDRQLRILVAPKDAASVRGFVNEDNELKEMISDIREVNSLGGVIVETDNEMVSIDNSFDMRVEMLMPKILPEIGKKLFGAGE